MGKAKGKGAAAAAPPKCTCDHPFQCDCGNRPERPSKGHKWYPDDQIWAGKGHKQKGASGQTHSVSEQAKITATGKTQVAQWQRLPSQLLQEFCQRQKRPAPKYKNIGGAGGSAGAAAYKYRVVVCDQKDSDKDLFFVPAQAVANEEQAKEEGALLALLQLTPTLPHERKLPDPYKTTWLNAIQSQKNAATTSKPQAKKDAPANTASNADNGAGVANPSAKSDEATSANNSKAISRSNSCREGDGAVASSNLTLGTTYLSNAAKRQQMEEKRRLQNARIRKHDSIRMANQNHPVFMSAAIRKQIESLLRGDSSSGALDLETESDTEDDAATAAAGNEDSDAEVYVVHRLHSEGFSKRQARTAYSQLVQTNTKFQAIDDDEALWDQLYEECLQWLLVFLNEEKLPEGFDPRGRTLDVVVPASAATTFARAKVPPTDGGPAVDGENNVNSIDFATRHGITVREATLIAALASKQGKSLMDVFWLAIRAAATMADVTNNEAASRSMDATSDEMRETAKDELEALIAIFDSGCSVSAYEDGCSLIRVAIDDGSMTLEVLVQDGVYPGVHPRRITVQGKWPSKVGAALHVELAKFIEDLPLGEPMIFAIHSHAQDLVQSAELSELTLIPHLGDDEDMATRSEPAAARAPRKHQGSGRNVKPVSRPAVEQRRPRDMRKNFWSIHPRDAPPAVAFPKVSLSMERTRKSLPAASSRNEFLAAMKKAEQQGSRVVLVTGETGSGGFQRSSASMTFAIDSAYLTISVL